MSKVSIKDFLKAKGCSLVKFEDGIFNDDLIVLFGTSNQFLDIRAYFEDSERDKVFSLNKGTIVTVKCIGDSATIGSPVLRECTFFN